MFWHARGLTLVLLAASASAAAGPAKRTVTWPDEYQISWKFKLPYVDEYQKGGLTYTYQVWQDTAVGRQKTIRDDLERTLVLLPENHMYQVFPAGDDLRCWLEEIHGGTGPTLAAPAAPAEDVAAAAVASSRRLLSKQSAQAGSEGSDAQGSAEGGPTAYSSAAANSKAAQLPFVLPDLEEKRWAYKGLVSMEGHKGSVHLYEWELTQGTMDMKYRFYVDDNNTPLRLWQLGVNLYTGGHKDEYVTEFYDYTPGPIDPSVWEPPTDVECGENLEDAVATHSRTARRPTNATALSPAPLAMRHGTLAHSFALHMPAVHHGDTTYDAFCHRHGRRHRSAEHYSARAAEFHSSRRFVEQWNEDASLHRVALNHFADWTREEYLHFLRPLGGKRLTVADRPDIKVHEVTTPSNMLPGTLIWKGSPADSPVKDQGACGSCWAFSTLGAVEAAYYRVVGKQKLMSEQNLVDCGWDAHNTMKGCFGGEQMDAFDYLWKRGGIAAQADYPYVGVNDFCKRDVKQIKFRGEYVYVKGGEEALKEALFTKGPMTVSVDASDNSFRFYAGGLYTRSDCFTKAAQLDHAVIASGYGTTEDGQDYWLVKNTWSTYWGEEGYMRVTRSPNDCGIATEPIYVNLDVLEP